MQELKDAIIEMVGIAEDVVYKADFERLDTAGAEIIGCLDELERYRTIGKEYECQKAMQKQKPQKPKKCICTCPNCRTYNEIIRKRGHIKHSEIVYCWHCGQAMEV